MDNAAVVMSVEERWRRAVDTDPAAADAVVMEVAHEIAWIEDRARHATRMIGDDPNLGSSLGPGLASRLELLDRYRELHRRMTGG